MAKVLESEDRVMRGADHGWIALSLLRFAEVI